MKSDAPHNYLIVCNGEIDSRLLKKFFELNSKEKKLSVIAADGAANTLYKLKLIPDLITGDFDSIEPAALNYFKSKKAEIRKIFNQNRNDFAKALGFAISRMHRKIFVLGATGKRLDHTLNNLSILKQHHHMADIKLYDSEFEIFYSDDKTEFNYPKGEVVSLIALLKAEKIKTKGLKYPLKDSSLEFGNRQGALNSSNAETVNIEVCKGELLVFKKHFGKITV